MFPILYQYKFITIGSYGLMLGLAFYIGFLLAEREFTIHGKDPELAYRLLLWAIPSAIVGAKLAHILENMEAFFANPMGVLLSGAGLSVYGGLLMALLVSAVIIRRNGESVLNIFDLATPTLAVGYGLGRIGCHVSGDGCYGITTNSILGVAYPNGIVPISTTVYPTPLFESLFSFIVAGFLLKLRRKDMPQGTLFFIYLILNAVPRFLIEFIRLNPEMAMGLTQAQVIAIGLFITGILGIFLVQRRRTA